MYIWDVNFSDTVSVSVRADTKEEAQEEAISILKWTDLANGDGTGIFFLRNYSNIVVRPGDTSGDFGPPNPPEEDE